MKHQDERLRLNLFIRVSLFVLILILGTLITLALDETPGLALVNLATTPLETVTSTASDSTLYALGQNSSIYHSIDQGHTWQVINFTPETTINALAVHPLNSNVLYVGTAGGSINVTNNLWRSNDGGQTWQKFFLSLPATLDGAVPAVTALAIESDNPNMLYVGTAGQGLYRLEVGRDGQGYTLVNHVALNEAEVHTLAIGSPEQVYAMTNKGILVIMGDKGRELKTVPELALSLAVDPNNEQVLYAGGYSSGVYRSEDGGQTWENRSAGLGLVPGASLRVTALTVDQQDANHLVAATAYGLGKRIAAWGIYESHNAGQSWDKIAATADSVTSLTVENGVIYAATGKGLKRYGESSEPGQLMPDLRSLAHPSGTQILVLTLTVSLAGLALLVGPNRFTPKF
jgi:photosystem II stability/assembly factor-like uncharacterized protein